MFMESKLQYYKDVPPFQIDPCIYFVTLKIPKRCLFWQVSIEEWIVELTSSFSNVSELTVKISGESKGIK